MHPNRSCAWAAAALATLLAACHPAQPPPHEPEPAQTEADAGAPVLAAVQNARAAIAAGDTVAAFNDVDLGVGYAASLPGARSALYPPEAAPPGYHSPSGEAGGGGGRLGGHGGRHRRGGGQQGASALAPAAPAQVAAAPPAHRGGQAARSDHAAHRRPTDPAQFSAFDAQVMLQSAQAKLQARDTAGADADLGAVEAAARRPTPANLPLVRAGQSLTLATGDVAGGRLPELRTQLAAARASLDAYQGGPHAADAKALAAAIDQTLNQPDGLRALPPAQLALWSGRVSGWI